MKNFWSKKAKSIELTNVEQLLSHLESLSKQPIYLKNSEEFNPDVDLYDLKDLVCYTSGGTITLIDKIIDNVEIYKRIKELREKLKKTPQSFLGKLKNIVFGIDEDLNYETISIDKEELRRLWNEHKKLIQKLFDKTKKIKNFLIREVYTLKVLPDLRNQLRIFLYKNFGIRLIDDEDLTNISLMSKSAHIMNVNQIYLSNASRKYYYIN